MIGIVSWFNVPKGYGEIYSESGEVFFFTYLELPELQKFRTIERGTVIQFGESIERQFGNRVAKKIKPLRTSNKKQRDVVEQLRSALP